MSNVDHAEIAKFEALAHRWWDRESEFKPLHDINPLRLGYVAERCGGLRGKAVLDVGCAKGFMLHDMALLIPGIAVTGVDVSEYAVAHAIEDMMPHDRVQRALETRTIEIAPPPGLLEV